LDTLHFTSFQLTNFSDEVNALGKFIFRIKKKKAKAEKKTTARIFFEKKVESVTG
jgi:hypothetical protein